MSQLKAIRYLYAQLVSSAAGIPADSPVVGALATVPRELFLGRGPWQVSTGFGYVNTVSRHPAVIYQNVLVALKPTDGLNNGLPSLHAANLQRLNPQPGQTVVHIGAGTGYYSAVLAELVGPTGRVHAFELDPELALRARDCLSGWPNVTVHERSGACGILPECHHIYVSAGATGPPAAWLDALPSGGRLIFPLTSDAPEESTAWGAMLCVTATPANEFTASFGGWVTFVPCTGARDAGLGRRLYAQFHKGRHTEVRSLRRGTTPDETCWISGDGWWLSTDPVTASAE